MELSAWQIIVLVVISVIYLIYLYLSWNFNYWKKRGVIGPQPKIIQGTFPSVINQKRQISYDVNDIYYAYKGKTKFVGIFMTRCPQLLIIDPQLAKSIYVTNFKYFHDNESSLWIDRKREPISANNPFNLTGQEWKDKRAEIVPALTANRIKGTYPSLQKICSFMTSYLKCLEKNSESKEIDGKDLATRFTAEAVAYCVYGVQAETFTKKDSVVLKMAKAMIRQTFHLIAFFFFTMLFPYIKKIYHVRFFPKEAETFFVNIMNDSIDMRERENIDRADFLGYLMKLKEKKNLTRSEMASHTLTFFFDAFETSSVVISHFLLQIARYQDIQQKLREEIMSVIDDDGNLNFEALMELPYLEQCLDESLRMFPPVLFSSKICTEEIELENTNGNKLKVEVGQVALIPVFSFHLDEQFYPEPFEYKPERFSPENGGSKKYKEMGVYYPFGDGPRICLGMRFGIAQTKAVIAELVRNFKIFVNPKTRKDNLLDPTCFLAMLDGGIWLDFESI